MKRLVALAALLAVATPAAAQSIDSTCWFYSGGTVRAWPTTAAIPVYINISEDRGFANPDAGWDPYLVALAIQVALSRWNEESGTPLRFTYVGPTFDEEIDGAVVVSAGGCSNQIRATAAPADPDMDGVIDYGTVRVINYPVGSDGKCDTRALYSETYTEVPEVFVDLLVHELGHVLGRRDAYGFAGGPVPPCGQDHRTIMRVDGQDLTGFDKAEHQRVYGTRVAGTTLKYRSRTGTAGWSSLVTTSASTTMVRPGPGSSFGRTSIPVTLLQVASGTLNVNRVVERIFSHAGSFAGTVYPPTAYIQRNPVATAFAADGSGIMAYVGTNGDDLGERFLCTRAITGGAGAVGPENCRPASAVGCTLLRRNGVGAAYDPLSGRFIVAWGGCSTGGSTDVIGLLSVPRPGKIGSEARVLLFNNRTGEAPAVACANDQPIDLPLWQNCRLAYAASDEWGQPIETTVLGIGSFGGFVIGATSGSTLFSEHAPALAWFAGKFHLAYSRWDRDLYHYARSRTATSWSYQGKPAAGGYISPPFLSTTRQCTSTACTDKLHLFWLAYPDPRN